MKREQSASTQGPDVIKARFKGWLGEGCEGEARLYHRLPVEARLVVFAGSVDQIERRRIEEAIAVGLEDPDEARDDPVARAAKIMVVSRMERALEEARTGGRDWVVAGGAVGRMLRESQKDYSEDYLAFCSRTGEEGDSYEEAFRHVLARLLGDTGASLATEEVEVEVQLTNKGLAGVVADALPYFGLVQRLPEEEIGVLKNSVLEKLLSELN